MPLEIINLEHYPSRGWVGEIEARDPHGSVRRKIVEAQTVDDAVLMALEAYYSIAGREESHARKPDQVAQADDQARSAEVYGDGAAETRQQADAPRPTARPTLSLQDRDQRLRR